MPERELSTVVASLYEAVTGTSDWADTGKALCEVIGANSAIFSVVGGDGALVNLLGSTARREADYNSHYRFLDPIRPQAESIEANGDWLNAVRLSDELMPVNQFRESEFYRDFARHHGLDHMMIGVFGDPGRRTLLTLFRDRIPFSDEEKRTLSRLLPHAVKAVELRKRLGVEQRVASFQTAALDASASRILVVDTALLVHYANPAALEAIESRHSTLVLRPNLLRIDGSLGNLAARNDQNTARLRQAVADAAGLSRSSSFRLGGLTGSGEVMLDEACYACPLPQGASIPGLPETPGLAMLVLQTLRPPDGPHPSLLMELFGMSGSEAAVAVAILGGRSAEDVAAARRVSLDTVRTQLRAVLRKSDAVNLRDFERICAMLLSFERRLENRRHARSSLVARTEYGAPGGQRPSP